MMLFAVENSIVLALLGIVVLWFTFKRLGQRPKQLSKQLPVSRPDPTTSPADGHHLDAPASVARWEVAMHETARDLMGRLDSKIVIVEQLVRDAHQAAARLEAVLQRIEQANGHVERSGSDGPDPLATAAARPADGVPPSAGAKAADA